MCCCSRAAPAVERFMATKTCATPQNSLPLDLSDAAVKKLIRSATKRGYVAHDQINSVLPSEGGNSEQIEDALADVVEPEVIELDERRQRNGRDKDESTEPEMQNEGGEIVELKRSAPAKGKSSELPARTDDPVRLYLREMGSIELLSREGEIAIAKRIEAGREAMIAGLCKSPLTFQAIIIWRDELNEGNDILRDIIHLDATHAGPDSKAMPAPVIGPDGQPIVPAPGASVPGALAQTPAPPAAPATATPFKPASERADGEEATAVRRRPAKAISTTTIWRTRSRLPPSRPSSSPRWWRPSTTLPMPTSGCASCRTRTSRTSCATIRSRPRRSAATRSSRTTLSAR